jgi:hypothetical protein
MISEKQIILSYGKCFFFFFRREKQIRYPSRKARADVRKRVKGRFVKREDYNSESIDVTQSY